MRGSTGRVIVARAPVRISFGGGGTDLAAYYERFGGFVVSTAITRYCYVVAQQPADGGVHIISADYGLVESFPVGREIVVGEPLSLPKAAVEHQWSRDLARRGVDLFLASGVPPGSGLGSSSAMAAAICLALATYLGHSLTGVQLAERACHLEIERLGFPIGKQDQYASAVGGLNAIEFAANGVHVTPLRLPADVTRALNGRLLLFSTGRTHHSGQILEQQQRESRSKPMVITALHRIKELAMEMCSALEAQDLDRFGHLLDRSWQEKKRLSERISTGAIDGYYAAAREAGALGGKITGAGGGGFLLLYCPPRRRQALRATMAQRGLREMPFDFDEEGATVLTTPRERSRSEIEVLELAPA